MPGSCTTNLDEPTTQGRDALQDQGQTWSEPYELGKYYEHHE